MDAVTGPLPSANHDVPMQKYKGKLSARYGLGSKPGWKTLRKAHRQHMVERQEQADLEGQWQSRRAALSSSDELSEPGVSSPGHE